MRKPPIFLWALLALLLTGCTGATPEPTADAAMPTAQEEPQQETTEEEQRDMKMNIVELSLNS